MTIELQGLVVFGHHGVPRGGATRSGSASSSTSGSTSHGAGAAATGSRTPSTTGASPRSSARSSPDRSGCLLEALAGAVADGIVERFPVVERVRVRVRKPDVVLDPPVGLRGRHRRAHARVTLAYVGLGANLGDREEHAPARRRAARGSRAGSRSSPSRRSARPIRSGSSTSRRS